MKRSTWLPIQCVRHIRNPGCQLGELSIELAIGAIIQCVEMKHDSDEFRLSAGNYPVLETMEPSACQEYCNEGNFSYAAIMAGRYCLCSYTNYDYFEVDEQCCQTSPVSCGTDPDILLAMEVNEPPDITIHLSVQRKTEGVDDATKVIVEYNTEIKTNVLATLHLFYDGEIIREPFNVTGPDMQDKFLFTNAAIPGRHIASALVVDADTGIVSVSDEQEIFLPDTKVSFDLSCPEELATGETGICNITLRRGTDLQLRIKYGSDGAEDFVIPDAAMVPVGLPVPQFPTPDSSGRTLPPDIVYISVGELPSSQLVGLDFIASSSGSFEIQRYRTLNSNKTTMYYSIDMDFFYSKDNLVALHFKYDQARRRSVEWAQNEIAVVPDFHKRILFSDEAHFWLNGYVNK
ncbi:uncharacterized protein TNCV_5032941 [Trichonephila clavipes]|nr:uncharacterized protein TNCV_5032941 [Trichonephila clavipes]